jgi:hypothetical protein
LRMMSFCLLSQLEIKNPVWVHVQNLSKEYSSKPRL